ncbi:hypothetical protein AAC387_Pa01g2936 [Persea americana]
MKPSPTNFLDLDDPGFTIEMDVDDAVTLHVLSRPVPDDGKLAHSDFFNSFDDDFDDSDIA